MSSSLEDYAEVAIGFGYTALFVSALPMAAALALVSNAVEIRADGWRMLNLHQRPFPKGCEDIGSWSAASFFMSQFPPSSHGLVFISMQANDFPDAVGRVGADQRGANLLHDG